MLPAVRDNTDLVLDARYPETSGEQPDHTLVGSGFFQKDGIQALSVFAGYFPVFHYVLFYALFYFFYLHEV